VLDKILEGRVLGGLLEVDVLLVVVVVGLDGVDGVGGDFGRQGVQFLEGHLQAFFNWSQLCQVVLPQPQLVILPYANHAEDYHRHQVVRLVANAL
jgi:hypothetical protein